MIDLLDVEANYKIWCETCQAAKATRDPFNDIPYRAIMPVELVFSDLSGPFKICFGGFKYFGTFIDDYSDLTTVVLIKTKDEIFGKFQTWVKATEKAFGHEVQVLRTDGGGEYMSKAMSEWLEKKGILHHVTPPHTPQLNGKAERKNRTLKEMTAAMLIGSNMSTQWWGHAIMFACGLLMRITKTVDGRTVWEIIHKRKPSLTKAHAFGAECWVHIPAADRLKSDHASPKAWKGKLVSWPTERSGWGIYNPKTDKIVFSRDISFSPRGQEDTSNPQEEEIDSHEVIRVEDFLEPDDDEEVQEAPNDDEPRRRLPAAAEQREQPREAVRMGDRPVRELPRRVNRGQHSDWYRQNFVMFIQELEGHLFPISPTDKDPLTYEEALARPEPERQEWIDAIDREFNSLIKNGTLEEVIVPEGANVVSTKHVFKTKYDANVVFVYVDDILIAAKTKDIIDSVCNGLKQAYTMTDIGEVSSVLGISVRRTKDAYYLNQSVYIQTVLERFGLEEARSEPTPVATGTKLVKKGKEAVWLVRAVSDYGKPNEHPVLIRGDNQGALALAENPGFHRRTKHIELRYHYIRKLKSQGTVKLEYVDTHNQTADILTKPVSGPTLFKHRDSMGLQPPPGSTSR
ncbi:unnamed protein product [Tilletia caries]|nr:unnamed protein product [Tilletia caries]